MPKLEIKAHICTTTKLLSQIFWGLGCMYPFFPSHYNIYFYYFNTFSIGLILIFIVPLVMIIGTLIPLIERAQSKP